MRPDPPLETTHLSEHRLRGFLAGELPADDATPVAAHLDECPSCQELAEALTSVPGELWEALSAGRVAPVPAATPAVPGYDGLVELGRGGGGVVYRAREVATGRLVALKVLRAGALATASEQGAFLAEARAAAKLRHPNLVTVLHVGESAGLAYYAMEYLAAGSLAARLRGTPMAPREASALVEAVARAVHHAHERGVIHRDLKPGNILLDGPAGAAVPGAPKVGDFGMAKHHEPGVSATPSLAVLGTPSYMAPEQAFGRSRDVGRQADVYALGAILYELLAGRPPFRGASHYDTLMQVRTQEVVPPRRLVAAVPRDLETVCLKCLEKDPGRRYATAAALADDLRAYHDGRPVAARPVGWPGRLGRWSRRNPSVAALSAVTAILLGTGLGMTTTLWRRAAAEARLLGTAREACRAYTEAATKTLRNPWQVTREERETLLRAIDAFEGLPPAPGVEPADEDRDAYDLLKLADALHGLGEDGRAVRICERAVGRLGRVADAHPERTIYLLHYTDGCAQYAGSLLAASQPDMALAWYREAIRGGQLLVGREPNDGYRGSLAAYENNLAFLLAKRGRAVEAEEMAGRALAIHRELLGRHLDEPTRYRYFGSASRFYADLRLERDRSAAALWELMRERLTLINQARNRPNWPLIAPHLLVINSEVFALEWAGMQAEADQVIEAGLRTWEELAAREPTVPGARFQLAFWLNGRGESLWPRDPEAAGECFRRSVRVLEPLLSGDEGTLAAELLAEILTICPDPEVRDPARSLSLLDGATEISTATRQRIRGMALFEAGKHREAFTELEAFLRECELPAGDGFRQLAAVYLTMARHRAGETRDVPATLAGVREEIADDLTASWAARRALRRAEAMLAE